MTDGQLQKQLSLLQPAFLDYARVRWVRIGRPVDLQPEDLVQMALVRLCERSTLPDVSVLLWMRGAIRSISSNEAKARSRRRPREAKAQAGEPTEAEIEARALSMFEVVLGWLRGQAAAAGDSEMEAVLAVYRYEEFNESEVASNAELTVDRVRACQKRIKRLLDHVPQRIQDAIDDEIGRTP